MADATSSSATARVPSTPVATDGSSAKATCESASEAAIATPAAAAPFRKVLRDIAGSKAMMCTFLPCFDRGPLPPAPVREVQQALEPPGLVSRFLFSPGRLAMHLYRPPATERSSVFLSETVGLPNCPKAMAAARLFHSPKYCFDEINLALPALSPMDDPPKKSIVQPGFSLQIAHFYTAYTHPTRFGDVCNATRRRFCPFRRYPLLPISVT